MNPQARKNIRQAFPVIEFGSPAWEATRRPLHYLGYDVNINLDKFVKIY